MSLADKIKNAKNVDILTRGVSRDKVKTIKEMAIISAYIESERRALGMSQKQFAEYMGVSQGMVSKWESGEYNFTISTINTIFEKLNMTFNPVILKKHSPKMNGFKHLEVSFNSDASRKRFSPDKSYEYREGDVA